MVHLHEVRDTDSHFVIDPITRAITNPNSAKNRLMQGDHNSEIYTFEIPKEVEGHDMTLCNAIRIHYNDISADKANESRDFYPVADMHIDEVQRDTLVFSWLVSGNATMYAGLLSFRIQFLCIDDSNNVTYKWHTDIFKGITISDGFDNSEAAIEEYADQIAAWEAQLFGAGDSVMADIENKASEQIASIEDARSAAVSAVEAKGAETLETIPDDYTELYGMANDAVRTRANAIVENVEGDLIAANDCSGDYLRGLRVFGKSKQEKTTGAQLAWVNINVADYPYLGVTCSATEDGNILLNGTATDNLWNRLASVNLVAGETYTLSAKEIVSLSVWDVTANGAFTVKNTGKKSITFVAPNTGSYSLCIENVKDTQFANVHADIMLNSGELALPWEPYTGGVASPSPEYPQEINSVENAVVAVCGKNLLKVTAKTQTTNGITFTVNDDGSVTIDGTATAHTYMTLTQKTTLPVGSYVLSGCNGGGSTSYFLYFDIGGIYNFDGETEFTVDIPSEKQAIIKVHSGVTVSNVTIKPMVRLASVVNGDFEPHKEPQTVTIPHTLHGIPVSSGGNYTDANGQQWICDEVDLARGVYVQRVATVTFSGEEDWYVSAAQIDFGTRFDCNITTAPVALVTDCLCNRFQYKGVNAFVESAWILEESQGFRIITEKANTAEELKAFLAANPTTMQYVMYKPVETSLTDAEIVAFKALHSNYPNTTVLNDAGAWMEVAYNADTELYFNNSRGATDEQVQKSVDAWLANNFVDAEEVAF